jgi:hypothetical protein
LFVRQLINANAGNGFNLQLFSRFISAMSDNNVVVLINDYWLNKAILLDTLCNVCNLRLVVLLRVFLRKALAPLRLFQ